MTRLTLRGLASHKLRSVLTSIAIVLGVAMVTGTFVLRDQITNAFSEIFQSAFAGTDVILSHKQVFTPQGGGDAGPLPASLIPQVRAVPGVAKAEGQIQALGAIVKDGKYIGSKGGAPNLVFSSLPEPFNQDHLTAGRFPSASGEIAVNTQLANDNHLRVGEQLGLATEAGLKPVTLVGVFNFANSPSLGGATLTELTFSDAQRWFDRAGRTSVIVVSAKPGVSPAELKQRIIHAVPAFVKVQTGSEAADEQTKQISGAINSFLTPLLLAFAGAAILVGAFIIFNTFSITVAQRMREFAMLRTIGASRRQVLEAVMGEALVIALAASVVGIAAGVGFAKVLNWLFGKAGFGLPLAGVRLSVQIVAIALVLGVAVTLLSALVPALRTTRVPPIAALREGATLPRSRFTRAVPYLAVLMLVGGVLLVLEGFTSNAGTSTILLQLAIGSVVIFIGAAMGSRYVIRPLARAVGWPIERLSRAPGRLARENAVRNPGRTATTAAALMIGIALVVFVAVFANGFKQTFLGAFDRSVKANLVIQNRSQGQTLPPGVVPAADGAAGVQTATGVGFTQVKIGHGGTDTVNGVDPSTFSRVYSFDWQKGGSNALLGRLQGTAALIEEQFAKSHRLSPGDTFQITAADGRQMTLRVLGQYKDPVLLGGFIVAQPTYRLLTTDAGPQILLVRYRAGVSEDAARASVTGALGQYPAAKVQTAAEYKKSFSDQINIFLTLLYVLLAMSVVISLFGIVNTLALSVFERTREIGMLRAIGITRTQLKRMIRLESVITAVIGGLLGIVIGVVIAWIVTQGLKDQGIVFAVPWGDVVASLIVAALAGAVAAWFPARRAAKLDVLDALQYE